jgi:hypothetical protein
MKRTLIQFDEETYGKLRHTAFERKQSVSALVRELVAKGLKTGKAKKFARLGDFSFIGSGSSKPGRLGPVSERHDEALTDIHSGRSSKK